MIFPQIFPCSNYILCPDICVNTREFDYTPVSTTGQSDITLWLLQGIFYYRGIWLYKEHIVHCTTLHYRTVHQPSVTNGEDETKDAKNEKDSTKWEWMGTYMGLIDWLVASPTFDGPDLAGVQVNFLQEFRWICRWAG